MPNATHYRIVSLLYSAVSDDAGQTAYSTIRRNFADLGKLTVEAASQGAQIMVFPESMTGTLEWPNFNRRMVAKYAEVYPKVGTNLCRKEFSGNDELYQHYTTACWAVNTSMYLVMNIPELLDCTETTKIPSRSRTNAKSGGLQFLQTESPPGLTCDDLDEQRLYLFNALAIYDPSGTLVAKYRKTSTNPLYYDTAYPPQNKEKVDYTTYDTDFGVTFGVLVCADATHPMIVPQYAKAGIRNILLPLYDGGRPPVTSISAIHAGHSLHHRANVIASQSQTFSGAGIYTAGRTVDWNINTDPFSGAPYRHLIVQDLPKEPATAIQEAMPKEGMTKSDFGSDEVETCRWLGNTGTEVRCPCKAVRVGNNETVSFEGTLVQPIQLEHDGETTNVVCHLKGDLSGTTEATTYAMMVGWRNSSQLDYVLFCELVICRDFPDCSKDCPLCTAPYMGEATLSNLQVQATVPRYFEGERMMPLPVLNGMAGMPQTQHVGTWALRENDDDRVSFTRYMTMRKGSSVDNLMGAGLFYIGFAPLPRTGTTVDARDEHSGECSGTDTCAIPAVKP